jgi:hypothetical protein
VSIPTWWRTFPCFSFYIVSSSDLASFLQLLMLIVKLQQQQRSYFNITYFVTVVR